MKPIKIIGLVAVLFTGYLLLSAVDDFPAFGDPKSPPSQGEAPVYYITQTAEKTHVPNLVTAVLADYRGYDTMFETVVIFVAGIAILSILRVVRPGRRRTKKELEEAEEIEENYPDEPPHELSDSSRIIVGTTVKMLVPVIQLFALYVLFHGHYSPGGGFQGGVIFGASFILLAIADDLKTAQKRLSEKSFLIISAVGIFLYAGFGYLCFFLGGNFLDYEVLHPLIPTAGPVMARYHAMLGVEVGVAFTVTAIMFGIYTTLASRGRMNEGL